MKINTFVRASHAKGNPPVMSFSISPSSTDPDWLDAGAHLSQQVTRESIQQLRTLADESEAMLNDWEREKAIREEIEARLAS